MSTIIQEKAVAFEKRFHCEHEAGRGVLLSNPPQYSCGRCPNIWKVNSPAPICQRANLIENMIELGDEIYDIGYKEGESSKFSDWQHLCDEFPELAIIKIRVETKKEVIQEIVRLIEEFKTQEGAWQNALEGFKKVLISSITQGHDTGE